LCSGKMAELNYLQAIDVKKLISEKIKLEPKRVSLKLPDSIDLILEEVERGREPYAVVLLIKEKSGGRIYTLYSSKILEEAEKEYVKYSDAIKSGNYTLTFDMATNKIEIDVNKTA